MIKIWFLAELVTRTSDQNKDHLRLQKGIRYYNMNQHNATPSALVLRVDLKTLHKVPYAREGCVKVGLQPTCIWDSYAEQELFGLIIVNFVPPYRLAVKFLLPGCIGIHVRERPKAPFTVNGEKCILLWCYIYQSELFWGVWCLQILIWFRYKMASDLLSSNKAEEFVGNTKIKVLWACISLELSGCSTVFQNVSFGPGHLISP